MKREVRSWFLLCFLSSFQHSCRCTVAGHCTHAQILSYHRVLYRIMLHHIIEYFIILHYVLEYYIVSYHIVSLTLTLTLTLSLTHTLYLSSSFSFTFLLAFCLIMRCTHIFSALRHTALLALLHSVLLYYNLPYSALYSLPYPPFLLSKLLSPHHITWFASDYVLNQSDISWQ